MPETYSSNNVTPEEIAAATAPAAEVPATTPAADAPEPKKKRGLFVAAIVLGALVLLSGATVAAYNLWYQNPERVVLEAVSSVLREGTSTHKITVDIQSKDVTVKITVNAAIAKSPASKADVTANVTYKDKDYSVTGSTLTDKDGNVYFKINDVKALMKQLVDDSDDASTVTAFDDIMTKIDGQWIKISSDDLKSVSEEYSKTQKCTADALKSLDEKANSDELYDVYKKNSFVVVGEKIGVKTIDGDASLGYKVTLDDAKAKTFYTALGQTKVGKALTACDSTFDFKPSETKAGEDSAAEKTTSEIHVWSSRFGHELKELDISAKDADTTTNIVWNPSFGKSATVTPPATSTSLKELTTDFENAFVSMYDTGVVSQ